MIVTLIVCKQLLTLFTLIGLIRPLDSAHLMVNNKEFTDDHHHYFNQTRFKRSKTDRWPLETWQTSPSSSPTVTANKHQHQQIKSSASTLNIKQTLTPTAQNIKCNNRGEMKSFTSMITLPSGYTVPPIFEDHIESNGELSSLSSSSLTTSQNDCSMTLVSSSTASSSSSSPSSSPTQAKVNIYSMKINDFNKCGVKSERSADGKEWMSVTLRVPFISGLRTAQDEHIVIVCRPQELVMAKSSLLDFRTNVHRPIKTVYSSLEPEVDVKVGLFAKPAGLSYYSEEIPIDGIIEVGEELQFRAIVKPGDGWKYAKLTDLKVYMVHGGVADEGFDDETSSITNKLIKKKGKDELSSLSVGGKSSNELRKDSTGKDNNNGASGTSGGRMGVGGVATLVLDNGCRNPVYSALAPYHPYRDTSNPLAVAFNFKAFMFQDMPDDGSIRITAKIMACLEEADCSPSLCLDNGQQGYGRRRKRNISRRDNNLNHNHHRQQLNVSIKKSSNGDDFHHLSNDSLEINSFNQLTDHLTVKNNDKSNGGFNYSSGNSNNFEKHFQFRVVLPGYTKNRYGNVKLTTGH